MDRVPIAVIGAGWWATQHHIPGLLSYPRAELVGVADTNPDQLRAVTQAYGITEVFTDYGEMFDKRRPAGVVVAVPHAAHYQVAKDALDAGVSVMLEKPMTLNAAEAWYLANLARVKGLHLTVGYPWNYTRHAAEAKRLIASGELGSLQLVSGVFASMVIEYLRGNPEAYRSHFNFPVTGPGRDTYSDPKVAGGGQGHLQVSHLAGLMFWITGLRPATVFALMNNLDVRVDVIDAIAVEFEGSTLGTLCSTGNMTAKLGEQHELRVYGSDGWLRLDPIGGTLVIRHGDGSEKAYEQLAEADRYPAEATARNLVDLILGGTETCGPAELGAITVDLLEAAYRSAASGSAVRVQPKVA